MTISHPQGVRAPLFGNPCSNKRIRAHLYGSVKNGTFMKMIFQRLEMLESRLVVQNFQMTLVYFI